MPEITDEMVDALCGRMMEIRRLEYEPDDTPAWRDFVADPQNAPVAAKWRLYVRVALRAISEFGWLKIPILPLAVLFLAAPAFAQQGQPEVPKCVPSLKAMLEQIAHAWNEKPIFQGIADPEHMVTLTRDAKDSSWTFIITNVQGQTCIMASGLFIEALPAAKGPPA